ncbi:MAG: DUF1573 domain-containing protein [Holophagae bacterium]|jgi:hypothetical protein
MRTRNLTHLVLAVLVVAASSAAAQAQGTPRLVVPSKIIDIGTVSQGVVADAVFELVNEGDAALVVKAVRPTCGCTVADFDREIPAGGKGKVEAKLDTKDFAGPISKSILVMTDDPQMPTVTLVIKADVRPFIEVLPRPLVRFNAVLHEPMSQTFTVVGADPEKSVKVLGVDSSVPFITTSVRKLGEDELIKGKSPSQYEVTLALADDAPIGPVNAVLTVKTDLKEASEVPVKVYGVIRSLIHVTPSQVQFGSVEAASRPGRNLIVVNNRTDGSKMEITDVAVDDPAFAAQLAPIEDGRRYQVTVMIKPDADPGSRNATLTLTTTDKDFPKVTVPIRANIR